MLAKLKTILSKIFFGLNVVASLLLLGAYLAAWIPPSSFYWFSFLAIGFPFLFFANILFVFWWFYKRKRYIYLPLICLCLGYQHFLNTFAFNLTSNTPSEDSIRVLSYNVRYFNATSLLSPEALYKAQQKILRTIQEQPIDLFFGQEFTGKTADYNKKSTQFLKTEMGLKYHFTGGESSLAIYSKYPILKKGTIDFEDSYNGAIYADIKYENRTIRAYCFHLQSIRLGSDESEIFAHENLTSLSKDDTQEKYKRINKKIKQAFLLREEQANFIAQHIKKSPYPVLVCGDMNDTPNSYAYRQLSKNLKDAFKQKGIGVGSTYAGNLPFLRIDYIFTNVLSTIEAFEVCSNTSSDHYPIYAHIKL